MIASSPSLYNRDGDKTDSIVGENIFHVVDDANRIRVASFPSPFLERLYEFLVITFLPLAMLILWSKGYLSVGGLDRTINGYPHCSPQLVA